MGSRTPCAVLGQQGRCGQFAACAHHQMPHALGQQGGGGRRRRKNVETKEAKVKGAGPPHARHPPCTRCATLTRLQGDMWHAHLILIQTLTPALT